MSVQKIAVNETVLVGQTVIFTINVTNTGDSNLTNVVVNESSFDGLKYAGVFSGDYWVDNGDNTFTYNAVLVPGESALLNIIFDVEADQTMDIINTVVVSSNETGDVIASNSTRVLKPNMTVEKIAVNKTVLVGENVIFTINVTNSGDSELTNVNVVENIPNGLQYNGEFYGEGWKYAGNNTFVLEGILKPGESAYFNIVFVVDGNVTGDIENPIIASCDEISNVSAKDKTTVLKPEMSVEISHDKKVANINDTIKYTISISNYGNCDLMGIYVQDKYMDDLVFESFDNPENWDYNNGTWTYKKSLGINETISLNVYYTAKTSGVKDKTFVIGNAMTSDEFNGTEETIVNTTDEVIPPVPIDDEPLDNETSPYETNTTSCEYPSMEDSARNIMADKHATGNPLVLVLLVLLVLGFVPKRKN